MDRRSFIGAVGAAGLAATSGCLGRWEVADDGSILGDAAWLGGRLGVVSYTSENGETDFASHSGGFKRCYWRKDGRLYVKIVGDTEGSAVRWYLRGPKPDRKTLDSGSYPDSGVHTVAISLKYPLRVGVYEFQSTMAFDADLDDNEGPRIIGSGEGRFRVQPKLEAVSIERIEKGRAKVTVANTGTAPAHAQQLVVNGEASDVREGTNLILPGDRLAVSTAGRPLRDNDADEATVTVSNGADGWESTGINMP